jgi:hypothetical protein
MVEVIAGFGFSAIIFFIGYCIHEVRRVKSEVLEVIQKEKVEAVISSRRLDALDNVVSDLTEFKFSTRAVVENGHTLPRTHPKIVHLIHGHKPV